LGTSDDRRGPPGDVPKPPPAQRTQYGITAPRVPAMPQPPPVVPTATAPSRRTTDAQVPVIANPLGGGASFAIAPGACIRQYELIRELGRGGAGMVWAARDTKLGRRVAIKFLRDVTPEVAERFLTEARATAQCNHDNIVIIHEVDACDGVPYMVLEFLEGEPLRGVMGGFSSGNRLPASRVVELALPVARALARAHALGIVHRDLKPENVFVTTAGQVKVLDFGIAKAFAEHPRHRTLYGSGAQRPVSLQQTSEGELVGTLPYMSPEQMGMGEVDHRSDLWSLGIMMFEMLSGHHPVQPLTSECLITNAVSDEPMLSIRAAVPEIPDALAAIVDGCLRKPKGERIASASELVRLLEELLPGRHGRKLAEGESPYPGLTAFQESDADRFFGRGRDVTRMVARVRELPLTGIVGPSGVGKSSFIRAGVGPALKASGERWDVVTLRPGREPLAALASVVQRLTTHAGSTVQTQMAEHQQLMYRLRTEPGYVGTLLRSRARQIGGNILLFIDQFEELYTLVPDPGERRAFTAAISGVADDTAAPLRVVVSMRSDFLDRVAEDPRFMEDLSRGLVFLSPPDRVGLREALVAPVEMVGYRFESAAMVEDMLDALATTPGALPLLQFAAAKLWDARDRQHRLLSIASYHAIGGISGALATHADEVVAQMNAPLRHLAQNVFRRLVTPERTRAIVELADLDQLSPNPHEVRRVLEQLVAARLLVVQSRSDAGGGSVEIVHESLIDRWPTLRRWLDEGQEDAAFVVQLSAAAKQWEAKGRPAGLLWRGEAMEEARRWFALRPRELTARDRAFLDAVLALARRGARARRAALFVVFLVLAGVAGGAMVALVRIRGAEQEASENASRAKAEAGKATDALAAMQQKEHERLVAEQRKTAAEAEKTAAEAEKTAAEVEKEKAEQQVTEKNAVIEDNREELQRKNEKLATALRDASAAKERAEREQAKAEKSATELEKANAILQKKYDELEREKTKLTTKLKGM
jgi:serine/threonine protein kinase